MGEDISPVGERTGAPQRDTMQQSASTRTDSVMVRIYNEKNELIRNLKWKADTGFNRQWWGMEEKGVRNPGTPKPRPGAPEPGGFAVFPGTYKIVLALGKEMDSTTVTIKDDPRINRSRDVIVAQRTMIDGLRKNAAKLTEAIDRLTESEEALTKMQTQLRGMEGKEMDSLRKATTAVQDSIKAIRGYISGVPSDKQGITRSSDITVMNTMQTAQQYILAKSVAPGKQEEALVGNAEKMINTALGRINRFYATRWSDYRKQVEGTKINLFKEYAPIQ